MPVTPIPGRTVALDQQDNSLLVLRPMANCCWGRPVVQGYYCACAHATLGLVLTRCKGVGTAAALLL